MDDDEWTVGEWPYAALFGAVLFGWIAVLLIALAIVSGG
jgi:hypothetical protein